MNIPLYQSGIKNGWKLLLIFCAVLTMYFMVIITMFDPAMGNALAELERAMPELMAMMGMGGSPTTLVSFMANYLYGFIMLVFPMVFSMIIANRLLAHYVDRGSMAYLLAAPVKRSRIVLTQMLVLISGILAMMLYAVLLGFVTSALNFPGALDVPGYLAMNLGAVMLQLFIGGICFLASGIFNDTKYSIAFGAGIPILSYIFQMIADFDEKLRGFRYLTFFSLYSPDGLVDGEGSAWMGVAILAAAAVGLYGLTMAVFRKKDIPV